jgi:hypothetical protein
LPLRIWLIVAGLVVALLVFDLAVVALFRDLDFAAGLFIGASTAVLFSLVAWLMLETAGARSFAIGGLAERWTAQELRRLDRGWQVIDDVPFNNCCNVDHVVVGPAGVFAVETKFTAVQWTIHDDLANAPLMAAIASARERAKKIANILNHLDRRSVATALVVWGPGAPDLPEGFRQLGDVLVCEGPRCSAWRRALVARAPKYDAAQVAAFCEVIHNHVKRQEAASSHV